MSPQPKHLIVYGSLLHPDELTGHGIALERVIPVIVQGWQRIFNQEPSWRPSVSDHRAVMNILRDENHWFNALLIRNISPEHIDELDKRERGYDRVALPNGSVTTYTGEIMDNCIVYAGKAEKRNDRIYPNRNYFELCKNGAQSHCEAFYQDYLLSTYAFDGRRIRLIELSFSD